MENEFFEISSFGASEDFNNLVKVVNQGIDSKLEGFTKSYFEIFENRLFLHVHIDELQILIRRLLELDSENSINLADSIVSTHYGWEIY